MMRIVFLFSLLAASIIGSLAFAEQPRLRSEVVVTSEIVTIGDFFENPGRVGDVPLFEAPNLGQTGLVDAWFVVNSAISQGLEDPDIGRVLNVKVTRDSYRIGLSEVTDILREEIVRRLKLDPSNADSLSLQIAGNFSEVHADPEAVDPVRIASLVIRGNRRAFSAKLIVDQGGYSSQIRVRGTLREEMEIITLNRPLSRGELVLGEDLTKQRVAKSQTLVRSLSDPQKIVGMSARRNLQAGRPLLASDFQKPLAISRGDNVTIILQAGKIYLTSAGEALQDGPLGSTIQVLNIRSKRVIQAIVKAKGVVSVLPSSGRSLSIVSAGSQS